jgi:hypothetical protein
MTKEKKRKAKKERKQESKKERKRDRTFQLKISDNKHFRDGSRCFIVTPILEKSAQQWKNTNSLQNTIGNWSFSNDCINRCKHRDPIMKDHML